MSGAPAVTVIIATYNWSSVLPYSIASVLNQTFEDFELLVIGDGCSDDSETVVAGISDRRLRWVNLPANSGHQSAPNNEGLRQAKGDVVAYLGHDDLWLPHHLACLIEAIRLGADIAYGVSALIGPGDVRIDIDPQRADYFPGMPIAPSGMLHRREVTRRIGGWKDHRELQIDPEAHLLKRAHESGFRLSFVPRLVTVKFPASERRDAYRNRGNSEQAAWWARIKAEPDFESIEQTLLLYAAKEGRMPIAKPYGPFLRDFLAETGRRIVHRLQTYYYLLAGKGSRIDANRRNKGLDPRS
jgi:glycosyltransferase involved in cell wall biosynthesis